MVTLVRCLGPGPEHQFGSVDPKRMRVCRKCKVRLSGTQGSALVQFVCRASEDNSKQDTYRYREV